jgi:uncharacterized protein with HEPN domain
MTEFRDRDYLLHIVDAIQKINRNILSRGKEQFFSDEVLQDSAVRNLEIIGEAVSKLSAAVKQQYPEVKWRQISAMRNRLIHGYITVNYAVVWDTINTDLPVFEQQITAIQKRL